MKKEDIEKVANLARLTLNETEKDNLTKDLTNILGYVETLNEIDLKDAKPTAHAVKVDNVFREDQVRQQDTIKDTLQHAPDHDDKFFLVPKVIES